VLTTIIGEAGREVMASRSRREAEAITDAAVAMIERLGVLPEGDDEEGLEEDVAADGAGPVPESGVLPVVPGSAAAAG
jgi:hypothetical protein